LARTSIGKAFGQEGVAATTAFANRRDIDRYDYDAGAGISGMETVAARLHISVRISERE
jgi:hypothetical protein